MQISAKVFDSRAKQIKRVYGINISRYRDDPDSNSSNFRFNPNEFELLKVLFQSIDNFPIPLTEAKFNDIDIRKKAQDENPDKFVKYIENVANELDKINQETLITHIYTSKVYDETLEWLTARKKLQRS